MDEWQATPPEEYRMLRAHSAQVFGDVLLCEAARRLFEAGGAPALDALRRRVEISIRESPDHTPEDDRLARIALEELERAIQLARTGETALRGWTEDAPPTLEEQEPGR